MSEIAELDGTTYEFTVGDGDDLERGEALIVRSIERTPDGTRVSVVPEKVVRATAARVLG